MRLLAAAVLVIAIRAAATCADGLAGGGPLPTQLDDISPAQRAQIADAVAAHRAAVPPHTTAFAASPPLYPFYPMAGTLYGDLFITNFVDLDPASGFRDWDCTDITYDGHDASDVVIRTFDEQAIGVPIFAALDGTVISSHDGEADMNTTWGSQPANYVVLDHGAGRICSYFHMKRNSVAVTPGQQVKAGQQIGLTGSSGISTGPHLHFATYDNGTVVEP